MAASTVTPAHGVEQVRRLLDLTEVRNLIRTLDEERWTGRPGYGNRAMVGLALAKSVYCLPTWHPPIPHDTERWWGFYRQRGAVERGFGHLKNERGLAPLRVRGLDRVGLHADLTILTTLAAALTRARAVPLAA